MIKSLMNSKNSNLRRLARFHYKLVSWYNIVSFFRCPYDKNYPTESSGTTLRGELQTSVRTVLSVSQVFSYLECAVICGMVHEGRAAEFNSDLLICTVIGMYISRVYKSEAKVLIYFREIV